MRTRALGLVILLLAACGPQQAAPSLSELDHWVLEQATHCELWGRPTEEAEQLGIPITDCDYYIDEAAKIRAR